MRVVRKIVFLALLLVITLCVPDSHAAIVDLWILPSSSYAEAVDNWQGWTIYTEGDFNVRIDYTVYDIYNLSKGDEDNFVDGAAGRVGRAVHEAALTVRGHAHRHGAGSENSFDLEGSQVCFRSIIGRR